jgi:hypothetical protein
VTALILTVLLATDPGCVCDELATLKPMPEFIQVVRDYDTAEALEDAHVAAAKMADAIDEAREMQAAFLINEVVDSMTLQP